MVSQVYPGELRMVGTLLEKKMKILALEVENVKHLKVVSIEPDGSLVVVGGDNAAGKTCVLDSIEYALNGASSIPSTPIRKGQKKAHIVLDLGDIVVKRTFTEKGTNLVVKNKDGATFASPQAMLDKLVGKLTFDPLEFSRMDSKKQAEVLKQLVGLNFNKLDADYKKLFDKRTDVNRQGKTSKASLDTLTFHEGVPETEVSVTELSKQYLEAVSHNRDVMANKIQLADYERELENAKILVAELEEKIRNEKKKLKGEKKIAEESIKTKMDNAESTNTKIRENVSYKTTEVEVNKLRKQSKSLSDQMIAIIAKKEKDLSEAKFPIKGLGVDGDEVTFSGIPFDQCSSAQQIKISVAMGLVMNPKLRILLIREGSLLDTNSLKIVAKMAEKADAQIWIERVSKGKECSIILEDGSILEPEVSNA